MSNVTRVEFFRPPKRPTGGTVYVRPSDPCDSDVSPTAPDLLAQVSDGVSWENRFDQSVRTVRFSVSGAPRTQRFAHGYHSDTVLFEPMSVELTFRNGKRRAVTVAGRRVLKSGQLGLRTAQSYYLTTRDDEYMPEWLKRLVAEVSSS